MKHLRDFTKHPALQNFPWEAVYRGLGFAEKSATTFNVGPLYQFGLQNVPYQNMRPSQRRWYLALKHGFPLGGLNVNLNDPRGTIGNSIFRCWDAEAWVDNANRQHFPELDEWIKQSGIFRSTGRILFFITFPQQHSPLHSDYSYGDLKAEQLVTCTDFLWLTDPKNPKQLVCAGAAAPWACWFDPLCEHETLPAATTQWSLRIDGVFNDGLSILLPEHSTTAG